MNDRACIYCRVSSEEQIQGTSLASQEASCRSFAVRNGWDVVRVFVELGESAKSADRTQFQAMIRFAGVKANQIRRVIVWKLDRFARQNYDFVVFQALLASAGVTIVSATEPAADGPAGKMMQSVLSVIAQFDNDVRAERTRTSMKMLAEAGYWCHVAPFGYKLARLDGKPILEPDPIYGSMVRHVFEEVGTRRMSVSDALRWLNDRGARRRKGNPFSPQAVHWMLRAPVYGGKIQSSLTRGVAVAAKFRGLVDEMTWSRVQMVLRGIGTNCEPIAPRKVVRDEFPLRGLIVCECGSPFTASWSRGRSGRYGYYHCKHNCAGARARIEIVHEQFRDVLRTISATHKPLMIAFREMVTRVHDRKHSAALAQRQLSGQRLGVLENKASVLLEKLLEGTITDAAYRAKNDQLQAEIAIAKVDAHEAEINGFDTISALKLADHMLHDLGSVWDRASALDRLRFERALFPAGIKWSKMDGVRTAISSSVFSAIRIQTRLKYEVASPTGCSSNPLTADVFLRNIWTIRDLVAAS